MKVLIVEDEIPALENLQQCIAATDSSIEVTGSCRGIADTVAWLDKNDSPDLILMDIQLSDGLCFHIFDRCQIRCPVIFTTAYDQYVVNAFEYNCIDYLLKPIDLEKLGNTLVKYKKLENHFLHNYSSLLGYIESAAKRARSRIFVRKGTEFVNIKMEEVVYFYTENKLVFLVDKHNRKFLCDTISLLEIEKILDTRIFFRVNRKYILNADFITKFRSIDKSKISIDVSVPVHEEIIVSQENAYTFKKWIGDL